MRHKRGTRLKCERLMPKSHNTMVHIADGYYTHFSSWIMLRAELAHMLIKLRRAAAMLRPCAFVATYPDGSYLLDPQWSRERAQWHKSKGARITRIRGVMEEW